MKRLHSIATAVLAVVAASLFAFALVGCGGTSSNSSSSSSGGIGSSAATTAAESTATAQTTYDSIYSDYSAQLKEAGPKAVFEFKSEAKGKTDANELAELANEKVQDLADIQVKGGEEMAALMESNGDEYSVYDKNFKKLYKVYQSQATDVYEAYLDKYAKSVPGMTKSMRNQMLKQYQETMEQMAPEQAE
jgi:hypothetical protein